MNTSLDQWLTEQCRLTPYQLHPLKGDASFRQYFRLNHYQQSYIVMDASNEKQSCVPFVAIAKALRQKGLHAPMVYASDFEQGFLLLTDFGHRLLLSELNHENATFHYRSALDALAIMQQCKVTDWTLKPFTKEFMRNELVLFKEWFLEKYLLLNLPHATNQMLMTTFDFLSESAANQPTVFMHRDYHSANLMILPENQVGILDFQDAFLGPITYDLVSLLRDGYIAWPNHLVERWLQYFFEKIALPNVSFNEFLSWFDLMGLQRHLKILLTFARKYVRDQNPNYLQHIPRTLNYILTASEKYAETKMLHQFIKEVMVKCVA